MFSINAFSSSTTKRTSRNSSISLDKGTRETSQEQELSQHLNMHTTPQMKTYKACTGLEAFEENKLKNNQRLFYIIDSSCNGSVSLRLRLSIMHNLVGLRGIQFFF